jgi:acyl carrier protein
MTVNEAKVKTSIIEFVNKNFLMGTGRVNFSENDSFLEKGIIDSTGVLEMVSFIQQKFGVKINDEDIIPENLDSVDNIANFIKRKQIVGS